MPRFPLAGAVLATLAFTSPLAAQKPAPKDTTKAAGGMAGMDHSTMGGMDHAAMHEQMMKQSGEKKAESWKALDDFHALMMATWHPAKDKNDLAPFRAKAADMVAAAKAVGASKAPASCGSNAGVAKAQAALPAETEKVAKLADGKTADAELKTALKRLHDTFEVLESACGGMDDMPGMKHDAPVKKK